MVGSSSSPAPPRRGGDAAAAAAGRRTGTIGGCGSSCSSSRCRFLFGLLVFLSSPCWRNRMVRCFAVQSGSLHSLSSQSTLWWSSLQEPQQQQQDEQHQQQEPQQYHQRALLTTSYSPTVAGTSSSRSRSRSSSLWMMNGGRGGAGFHGRQQQKRMNLTLSLHKIRRKQGLCRKNFIPRGGGGGTDDGGGGERRPGSGVSPSPMSAVVGGIPTTRTPSTTITEAQENTVTEAAAATTITTSSTSTPSPAEHQHHSVSDKTALEESPSPNVAISPDMVNGSSSSFQEESNKVEGRQQQQHHNAVGTRTTSSAVAAVSTSSPRGVVGGSIWPCYDELDKRLISIALPVIANFALGPLIGAVDLFWVNRMNNALAVAGQAAANQVFNSLYMLTSFLPSITATLVSKANASNNKDDVQDSACQALFIGILVATISTIFVLSNPLRSLNAVLSNDAPAMVYAKPYLLIRSFSFIPVLTSLVSFSVFRGILDTVTPVKISTFANMFNAILDPILIFVFKMGVSGAAVATLTAEIISAITYLILLRRRSLISYTKLLRLPSWKQLIPLLKGGAALQLRNVALNLTFLSVARVTQSIDNTGVAAAAHAMAIQTFQLGGIVLLGLSTVAQTVVPNDLVERKQQQQQIININTDSQNKKVKVDHSAGQRHTMSISDTANVTYSATPDSAATITVDSATTSSSTDDNDNNDDDDVIIIGGKYHAKATSDRLMSWGLILGTLLGCTQLLLLPAIRNSTPIIEVRKAATIPAQLGSIFQIMNGLVFIGEGIMLGTGSFMQLSISTVVATIGCLFALQIFPPKYGLTGVWMSFGVFNVLRFIGVIIHQRYSGPLAPRHLRRQRRQNGKQVEHR